MRKQKKRKYVARNTLQFQMNLTNEGDRAIIAIYEAAVKNRAALQMFRDAMRLLYSLQQKDLSVLFALFPELESQFSTETIDLIEEFRQMIESQFKQLPLPGMQPVQTGKSLSSAVLSAPVYDDDDTDNVVIRRDETAGQLSSTSFLDAAFGLKDVEVDLGTDAQHE